MSEAANAELRKIPLGLLQPHPRNPRLELREDVVEAIREQLEGSGRFGANHAPTVRERDGNFEIVAGHHRVEAARRAGLEEIPCWVASLSDEEAFMELVLSNRQSELTPLEVGIHALEAVPMGSGGRGRAGGLRQYARQIGKDPKYVRQLRDAAEVARKVTGENGGLTPHYMEKAMHLAAVHKAPPELWGILADQMLQQRWTVKETQDQTDRCLRFDVAPRWGRVFLPLPRVVRSFLQTGDPSPQAVARLVGIADSTASMIESHGTDDALLREYETWLEEGVGGHAWDARRLLARQREILAALERARLEAEEAWRLGDWRDHLGDLEDGSVRLLLTDPPYGMSYRSNRRGERHEAIVGDGEGAPEEFAECLRAFAPKLAPDAHLLVFTGWQREAEFAEAVKACGFQVTGSVVWSKGRPGMGDLLSAFAPSHERIIHATKGKPPLFGRPCDVLFADRVPADRHPTEKPLPLLEQLIGATTVEGELVADPYAGVASTLAAARRIGRRGWGAEIEERYHRSGRRRLEGEEV